MAFPLKFHQSAYDDFINAFDWYEIIQLGLGKRFLLAIEKKLKQISVQPEYYSKIYKNFRHTKIENFPYSIVFEFYPRRKEIHIASIHHNSKHPKNKYRKEVR